MFIQTLLHKPLCRFLILAAGAGTVGTTMHLVNAQKKIQLLDSLDIKNKPEIPEDPITPVTPPKEPEPTTPASPPSTPGNDSPSSPTSPTSPSPVPESPGSNSGDQGSPQQVNGTETDLVKFIQLKAKEIHDSNWVDTTDELGTIFAVISSVTQLKTAVEQYKQQIQSGQEQT